MGREVTRLRARRTTVFLRAKAEFAKALRRDQGTSAQHRVLRVKQGKLSHSENTPTCPGEPRFHTEVSVGTERLGELIINDVTGMCARVEFADRRSTHL